MKFTFSKPIIIGLVIIFICTLLIYRDLINLFFSQDDFFHLKVSQTDGSLFGFLKLISFRPFSERGGIYFYRPVFREILFNIYYRVFGLNPLPFRTTQFLIHFLNITLVFTFLYTLSNKLFTSFVGAFFFAIAALQIGVISYLAGGIQVSGMLMFYLTALLTFIKYIKNGGKKYKYFTIVLFLLALGSHEIALSLPFTLNGIYLAKKGLSRKIFTKIFVDTLPFFIISFIYIFLEVKVIGLPINETQYSINLSPIKLLNSYTWYFLWSLGVPEMLVDFVGPGIKLNPVLLRYWGDYYRVIFPTLLVVLISLSVSFRKIYRSKVFLFFIFLFFIGLAPVIFQPSHRLYYYLEVSLIGVSGIVVLVYDYLSKKKLFAIIFLLALFILNYASIQLSLNNYWAITRANVAKQLIADVVNRFPTLPKGANIYFTNDPNSPDLGREWGKSSKQASIILSGSDALQLVYKDLSLHVYYEDLEKPRSFENVYTLDAVIFKN